MRIPGLGDLPIRERRVIIRFDGDVPVEGGQISDDFRLKAVLPTLKYCREHQASIILLAHRGRPEGEADPELSNRILAEYFQQQLQEPVQFITSFIQPTVTGQIAMLENLRFQRGEEENSVGFAKVLSRLGDVYCNDAFGVSHRAHASISALPTLLPHCAGFHFIEEVRQLLSLRNHADAPYVVVLGGAKASDKAPVIASLIDRMDGIVIGGLVAVTYLAAMGYEVGAHKIDQDQVKLAQMAIRRMHEEHVHFYVPIDYINQNKEVRDIQDFAAGDLMLDVGPKTQSLFHTVLTRANTVYWNGAMGKFEDPAYAGGTIAVGRSIAHSAADMRIASGGDTVSAIHAFDLEKNFSFISTGGGATLEYIAGKELPGLQALLQTTT